MFVLITILTDSFHESSPYGEFSCSTASMPCGGFRTRVPPILPIGPLWLPSAIRLSTPNESATRLPNLSNLSLFGRAARQGYAFERQRFGIRVPPPEL